MEILAALLLLFVKAIPLLEISAPGDLCSLEICKIKSEIKYNKLRCFNY